ncbi:hypothetical protein FF86_103533 [Frankia sp. CpI1-P]|nr:hypothetical protein FF86_103533 [Frankia sp. CpI1-P]
MVAGLTADGPTGPPPGQAGSQSTGDDQAGQDDDQNDQERKYVGMKHDVRRTEVHGF